MDNKIAIEHMDKHYSLPGTSRYKCWGNRGVQLMRFDVLAEIDDLTNKSILDVGCGLGEFYYCCKKKGVEFTKYAGIDVNPKIVEQANKQSPELNISCFDILDHTLDWVGFDYVIASGLFNFECVNWDKRTWLIMKECYRTSKLGVAMNFLRFRKEDQNPLAHYAKYRDILEIVEQFTNRYVLRCDYKQNDFTIYLYKKQLK